LSAGKNTKWAADNLHLESTTPTNAIAKSFFLLEKTKTKIERLIGNGNIEEFKRTLKEKYQKKINNYEKPKNNIGGILKFKLKRIAKNGMN
jgi:hypothetical protein